MIDHGEFVDLAASSLTASREVRVNHDLNTFRVTSFVEGLGDVLGVVLPSTGTVTFYLTWNDEIADARIPVVGEFAARANEDLYASAFEFSYDAARLALRAGVRLGEDVESLSQEVVAYLLANALHEVESNAERHLAAVQAVIGGTSAVDAVAMITSRYSLS